MPAGARELGVASAWAAAAAAGERELVRSGPHARGASAPAPSGPGGLMDPSTPEPRWPGGGLQRPSGEVPGLVQPLFTPWCYPGPSHLPSCHPREDGRVTPLRGGPEGAHSPRSPADSWGEAGPPSLLQQRPHASSSSLHPLARRLKDQKLPCPSSSSRREKDGCVGSPRRPGQGRGAAQSLSSAFSPPTPPPCWPCVPEGLHPPIKSSVPQRGNTYLQAP